MYVYVYNIVGLNDTKKLGCCVKLRQNVMIYKSNNHFKEKKKLGPFCI